MPEVNMNASILIATSWQALGRAKSGNKTTELCNCTVTVLFAGFYIEENLDFIIKKMDLEQEMKTFLKIKRHNHPGLLDKLAWFFNCYAANRKSGSREKLFAGNILRRLNNRFPGFSRIYQIRNSVAHGKVNRRLTLNETEKLRLQAKSIVNDLLQIAADNGYKFSKNVTYQMAIAENSVSLSED